MKKTKISYILAALIIAVIAGFLFLRQSVGEPSVPRQEDLVTYTAKEYSFNYPKNWFLRDNSEDPNSSFYLSISNYDPNLLPPHEGPEDFFKIEVYKLPNLNYLTLQTWIENFVKESPTGSSIIDQREGVIDGHKTLFVNQIVGGGPRPVIYIARENFVYLIQGGSRSEAVQPFFDDFLQSFRFIKNN